MDPTLICVIGFLIMLALILLKVHVGLSMGIVGLLGCFYMIGPVGSAALKTISWAHTAKFELAVLPLFILMGMFISNSGIAIDLFEAASKWLGKVRGGLLIATTLSVGLFGACSGSSVAAATTFTKIAFPRLIEHKYDPGLSGAAIAAGGTQAALIPPSALLVFYGIMTELSIGKLLVAAVFPGIISVIIYVVAVWLALRISPSKGPGVMVYTLKEKLQSLRGVWAVPVIFVVIIVGLYLGFFTPSEAGAVGALAAFTVAVIKAGFKKAGSLQSLQDTANSTAMIFLILVGAHLFAKFVALTRVPNQIADFLMGLQLETITILIFLLFLYMLLGCIIDAVGMIALSIPVVYPVIESLGIDGIYFGILLVKVAEIGLITPPIGINCFVVKGVAGPGLGTGQLFKGITPFLIADIATLALLVAFPSITLWLPGNM